MEGDIIESAGPALTTKLVEDGSEPFIIFLELNVVRHGMFPDNTQGFKLEVLSGKASCAWDGE